MLAAVFALALAGSVANGALAATYRARIVPLPWWLPAAEKQALNRLFGSAKPTHTYYISYPRKIAVIFEFNRVIVCRPCGSLSNASAPRGKVIRVSFGRQTHRLNGSMQFCESHGSLPRRSLCLHR
jgi:hypothetical protein